MPNKNKETSGPRQYSLGLRVGTGFLTEAPRRISSEPNSDIKRNSDKQSNPEKDISTYNLQELIRMFWPTDVDGSRDTSRGAVETDTVRNIQWYTDNLGQILRNPAYKNMSDELRAKIRRSIDKIQNN